MPQVSIQEFKQLPLRVHTFLTRVSLHDVWSVDLPRWRVGITLDDFLQTADKCLFSPSGLGWILLGIRLLAGRFFGWDRERPASTSETFASRLTESDRSKSLSEAGTRDGFFRVVYRFENEELVELMNRTVHAGALSTLIETGTGYHFYLAVYVRSGSRFTRFYMALIDPFRRMIVYPSLLRSVRARWDRAFGEDGKHNDMNCRCD
jgi:hypothetical protein